jgi:hypothetical protein
MSIIVFAFSEVVVESFRRANLFILPDSCRSRCRAFDTYEKVEFPESSSSQLLQQQSSLPTKIERKKEADAGRLLWLNVHRRRDVDGLRVAIVPPVLMSLVVFAMAVTSVMVVVLFSERRRYGQTTYHRSKGECHNDLAAG